MHERHALILHAALHNNWITLKHHTFQTFSSENIWFMSCLGSLGVVEPFHTRLNPWCMFWGWRENLPCTSFYNPARDKRTASRLLRSCTSNWGWTRSWWRSLWSTTRRCRTPRSPHPPRHTRYLWEGEMVSDEPSDKPASALRAPRGRPLWPSGQLVWIILTQPALWGSVPIISTSCVTVEVSGKGWNMPTVGKNASPLWRSLSCDCFPD